MRKVMMIVVVLISVFTLSSCGVEDVRGTDVRYLGTYNDELYFTLSDSKESYVTHLYKLTEEEFTHIDEFYKVHFSLLSEGTLVGKNYREEDVSLLKYNLDTNELTTIKLDEDYRYGRVLSYHKGYALFYAPGYQVDGDEEVILYDTIANEVSERYDNPNINVGYGKGDFTDEYIYLNRENTTEGLHKSVRINRATNEIEIYEFTHNYSDYGYDSNLVYYMGCIGYYNGIMVSKDDVPNSFFGRYEDISTTLFYDEETETFLFSYPRNGYVDILRDGEFERYEVEVNEYFSYGFINDSSYYVIKKVTYGSVFKRIVMDIEIRSIETSEILYTAGARTISSQLRWDKRD